MQGKDPATIKPEWRPFQLAFILMNLPGIANPLHADRDVVDLLFFPTGGGKTEAYLGLAAFTLVLRRLESPGIASAGLSVLMRYTLRLLTLDQLSRAATLICALELERQKDVEKLGEWPFEIGLWVGKAATPNVMGVKGDNNPDSARAKTIAFKNDDRKPSPIPLEECPWCGGKFKANSFQLRPNPDSPTDLRVHCLSRNCDFTRGQALPILAVDEPIYHRLPCFMIATVDKFAAMPWTGEVGAFFGRVNSRVPFALQPEHADDFDFPALVRRLDGFDEPPVQRAGVGDGPVAGQTRSGHGELDNADGLLEFRAQLLRARYFRTGLPAGGFARDQRDPFRAVEHHDVWQLALKRRRQLPNAGAVAHHVALAAENKNLQRFLFRNGGSDEQYTENKRESQEFLNHGGSPFVFVQPL
jgi:hypothetical protein